MTEIKEGSKVSVHYKGTLKDGTVFDSSEGRDPLSFEVGKGQIIPGFENAILGKKEGDKVEVEIKPEEAYGDRKDELVRPFEKEMFGNEIPPEGSQIMMSTPDGQNVPGKIENVDEKEVTIDLNHPLAGQELVFEITIESVE